MKLYSIQSTGNYGYFALEINVDASKLPDLKQDSIRDATDKAVKLIQGAIMEAVIADSPEAQERRKAERSDIVGLFEQPIHVEEIPNGYCPDWCCKHLPWFIITTTLGRFKIGWRKRVMEIDWSETKGTKIAEILFANESVTKGKYSIHAWSIQDAQKYIAAIMKGEPL